MRPDYDRLFLLQTSWASRPMRFSPEDERYEAQEWHTWDSKLFLGEEQAVPPLRLVAKMGRQQSDIMWCTYLHGIVVSPRLIGLLTAEHLSGWSVYAVDAFDRSGKQLIGYAGLAVTGRSGSQDLMRGHVIDKPPIVPHGAPYRALRGCYFKNDLWDGSDFCVMDQSSRVVVTQRVVDVLRREMTRDVMLTSLATYEEDISNFVTLGLWPAERRT